MEGGGKAVRGKRCSVEEVEVREIEVLGRWRL